MCSKRQLILGAFRKGPRIYHTNERNVFRALYFPSDPPRLYKITKISVALLSLVRFADMSIYNIHIYQVHALSPENHPKVHIFSVRYAANIIIIRFGGIAQYFPLGRYETILSMDSLIKIQKSEHGTIFGYLLFSSRISYIYCMLCVDWGRIFLLLYNKNN